LFITNLAFTDRNFADTARIGILAGSLLAGALGAVILLRTAPKSREGPSGRGSY
jgi:Na+/H+ antiporter NhaA